MTRYSPVSIYNLHSLSQQIILLESKFNFKQKILSKTALISILYLIYPRTFSSLSSLSFVNKFWLFDLVSSFISLFLPSFLSLLSSALLTSFLTFLFISYSIFKFLKAWLICFKFEFFLCSNDPVLFLLF